MKHAAFAALLLLAAGLTACQPPPKQNYFVFFPKWSAELDGQSRTLIRAASTYAKAHPADPIVVIGYADPSGSQDAHVDISATRAARVKAALAADGIPAERIEARAHGELQPTWTDQEARRVEIRIGQGDPLAELKAIKSGL